MEKDKQIKSKMNLNFFRDKELNQLTFEQIEKRKYFYDPNNGDKWEIVERFTNDNQYYLVITNLTQPSKVKKLVSLYNDTWAINYNN